MQAFFISFLGLWTGESIIYVGEDIENGDYPLRMLTMAEKKELQDLLGEDEGGLSRAKLNLRDFANEKSNPMFGSLGQMVGSKQYKQYPSLYGLKYVMHLIQSSHCSILKINLGFFAT